MKIPNVVKIPPPNLDNSDANKWGKHVSELWFYLYQWEYYCGGCQVWCGFSRIVPYCSPKDCKILSHIFCGYQGVARLSTMWIVSRNCSWQNDASVTCWENTFNQSDFNEEAIRALHLLQMHGEQSVCYWAFCKWSQESVKASAWWFSGGYKWHGGNFL